MSASDGVSLVVAFAALGVSWYGIWRANKTASAATLVTLNEGFRQAWARFLDGPAENRSYELAELMNLFEIACAVYLEKSVTGHSRGLLFDYIDRLVRVLVKNDYTNNEIGQLLQTEKTYEFIIRFLNDKPSLSVTIPPQWYQRHPGRL